MTPNETAVEHVRNLLQVFTQPWEERAGGLVLDPADVVAICVRLRKVLAELEPREKPGQREYLEAQLAGNAPHTALEQQQFARWKAWERGFRKYEQISDAVVLRAVGDHVERVYPEAASGTDEDYGSPILPPAHQDGAALRGQEPE